MPSIFNLRLLGMLGGGIAFAFLLWATIDRFSLADQLGDLRDDVADCADAAGDQDKPTLACAPAVATAIDEARAAKQCEGALAGPVEVSRFLVRSACGEQVKRLAADRDAKAGEVASLRQALTEAAADTVDAVTRAEARGAAQSTRKDRSDAAIDAAPRSAPAGGNSRRCDAECLRHLG